MISIDEEDLTTLHLTRGDKTETQVNKIAVIRPVYNGETDETENYTFSKGDVLSFIVKEKKGYTKEEILRKEITLEEDTDCPEITLTAEDTKVFPLKNKAVKYWYDIVLNNDVTILGYDEDGAKILWVYPEGGEL